MKINCDSRGGLCRPGYLGLALAATMSCVLAAPSAFAQTLQHPLSVHPVSLSDSTPVRPAALSNGSYYGYYYGEDEAKAQNKQAQPSPSDAKAKPEPAADEPMPAFESFSSGGTPAMASCNRCSSNMCGGSCYPSCYLIGPSQPYQLMPGNLGGFAAGGWTQVGYHSNETRLSTAPNDLNAFNDHAGRANVHQQWMWLEKSLSGDPRFWDWGVRADVVYGTDAQKTQAFGGQGWDADPDFDRNGGYGWALPQLYGEIGRGGFSVKLGHFYTPLGYEEVMSPNNFFYSHSLTMFNSEPFTHTGALATYTVDSNLELYGGWTAGWDTGFESESGGSNLLSGFSYNVADALTLTYMAAAGDFGHLGNDAYAHSIVADFVLTERVNYVLQTGYRDLDETKSEDFSINHYLFYTLSDCLGFGTRMEWWKQDGDSHYALTSGVNYRPHANLILRPELRHDWNPGNYDEQTTFGMDVILTY